VIESIPEERSTLSPQASPTRPPLRIMMISARAFPFMGGIESHIHEVSSRLVALGHEVTVLSADPTGQLPRQETADRIRFIRVPTWLSKSDYSLAPALYRRIMSCNFDVAHIQGYHTFVPPLGMLAAVRKKVPFVITFHSGGHSSGLRKLLRPVQWKALAPLVRKASRHVGVSDFEATLFSDAMGIPRRLFTIIPKWRRTARCACGTSKKMRHAHHFHWTPGAIQGPPFSYSGSA